LIEPGIEVSADGMVAVPTGPGIGVHVDWDRVHAATLETYDLRA
jgi:L-alanine-DL-glutamate epimerase-like enolase superfamily enzyme